MVAKTRVQVKLDSKGLSQLTRTLKSLRGKGVDVGFFGSKKHPGSKDITVTEIATVHEFGSSDGKIPQRPFMRQAFQNNNNFRGVYKKALKQAMTEGKSAQRTLFLLGESVRAGIVDEITEGTFTPLSPVTIEKKGSSKPLIDTGFMRNSVQWRPSE